MSHLTDISSYPEGLNMGQLIYLKHEEYFISNICLTLKKNYLSHAQIKHLKYM